MTEKGQKMDKTIREQILETLKKRVAFTREEDSFKIIHQNDYHNLVDDLEMLYLRELERLVVKLDETK